MNVSERLQSIQSQIKEACVRAGRLEEQVQIIAVTKYVSNETTREAIAAGIHHIGENRVEGLLQKQEECSDTHVKWHFIGSLQSRKVKEVIHHIDFIHSLDRLSLAKEIEKRAETIINCFVQVNVSGEESKHGLDPENVFPFINKLKEFPKVRVVGLMTMAPYIEDQEVLRNVFKRLKTLQKEIQDLKLPYAPCKELSMGMSNDFQLAVEEGATFVRIGTSLVGKEL